MTNNVIIIGRLTRDPVVKITDAGIPVVNFTLAVERDQKNSRGEKVVDFIPVVAWRRTAEVVGEHLTKGSLCSLTGSIQTRTFETSDGIARMMVEVHAEKVHFLSVKKVSKDEDALVEDLLD